MSNTTTCVMYTLYIYIIYMCVCVYMHTYMIYIYSKNIPPYMYECTIRVCVPSWYARKLFWKKSPFWTGCPAVPWMFIPPGLLNLDFAVRMTENHWALAGHCNKDARGRTFQSKLWGSRFQETFCCSVALLLCCSREKQKQEARFETKSRSKAFRRWCFCKSEFWLLCHDKSTILWSFCDHSVIILWSFCDHSVIILWSFCDHVDESAVDRSCNSHSAPGAGGLPRTEESSSWSGHRWTLVEKVLKLGHVRRKL